MESRRIETAIKTAVIVRNYKRARGRALTRLANAHPEEYKIYLDEEKANDHTQGKAWIDINGNTNSSMGADTSSFTGQGRDRTRQANVTPETRNI